MLNYPPFLSKALQAAGGFFLPPSRGFSREALVGRAIALALLLWFGAPLVGYSMRTLSDQDRDRSMFERVMGNVDHVFHEGGHLIFGLFGNEFLGILGGTLLQWLVPLCLAAAFRFYNKDAFAAAVMLWWLGESFLHSAPYINDARMQQLILLGVGTGREIGGHDWEYILNELGLIRRDVHIARDVMLLGRFMMIAGYAWAALALWHEWRAAKRPEGNHD